MARIRPAHFESLTLSAVLACSALLPLVASAQQADQAAPGACRKSSSRRRSARRTCRTCRFRCPRPARSRSVNSGAQNIVDLARNVAGLAIADLGPGPEPDGDPRHQLRPGDPRSARREGAGRASISTSRRSRSRCSRPISSSSTSTASRCCADRRARCSARARKPGTVRYITRQPQIGKFGGVHRRGVRERRSHGEQGGRRAARSTSRSATRPPRVVAVYWHHLPGFIDSIQPGGGVKKDVNDGDRTGARLAFLFKPNDALVDHAAHRVPEARDQRLSRASTSTTSWPTRTPPRSRR